MNEQSGFVLSRMMLFTKVVILGSRFKMVVIPSRTTLAVIRSGTLREVFCGEQVSPGTDHGSFGMFFCLHSWSLYCFFPKTVLEIPRQAVVSTGGATKTVRCWSTSPGKRSHAHDIFLYERTLVILALREWAQGKGWISIRAY